ncbi:hypothetical protein HK102_007997, partial [Quaeritorhiza haematococci]
EPINRRIMVRMLRKLLGPTATIYEAADGTEAVEFCAKLVASSNGTSGGLCAAGASRDSTVDPTSSASVANGSQSQRDRHTCPGSDMDSNALPTPPRSPSPSHPSSPSSISAPTAPSPHPLSVIFMDIIMPTMDGYTASQHIRAMGIETPIVVTTANIADEERGRGLGVVEALRKPFTRESVAGVLQRVGVL